MVDKLDKPRRRSSAGPTRRNSDRQINGEKSSRRRSTGFDSSDTGGSKPSDGGADGESFDPFGIESTEVLENAIQKKSEKGAPRARKAPTRSQSVGALPLNIKDFVDNDQDDEEEDDDMKFDAIDWDNTAAAAAPKKAKSGKSRRHSMDSGAPARSSEFGDDGFPKDPTAAEEDDDKKKKKKKSSKGRRQSLDSALASSNHGDDEDGFGPVKTFGFADGENDRRKGMARTKSSGSADMSIDSSESKGSNKGAPKTRGVNRRRSDNATRRGSGGFSMQPVTADSSYETETTADASLDSAE